MEEDARVWVMLELFRQRRVSAGKAAELSGLSISGFMDVARKHRIEWASYTDEELETEIREAVALGAGERPSCARLGS